MQVHVLCASKELYIIIQAGILNYTVKAHYYVATKLTKDY